MKICFLMYPWDKVTRKNSTLRLIHESVKRNHYVAITTPNDLGIRDSVTTANCEIFTQSQKVSPSFNAFRKNCQRYKERLSLRDFDAVLMRANPQTELNNQLFDYILSGLK